ncbi:manganese transporter permease [Rhodobacterales bacterium HKCCE2091]|nr:manganese transporter permease [Rhodobacterales bacterium HKCCE2091]
MTLAARLWRYQAERFPLLRTVPLLAVYSAASINISALLAGRPLPGPWPYVAATLIALAIFFQLRAADEWKDREIDARYRPERPVPRGLVNLRLVLGLGLATVPVAGLLALSVSGALIWPLLLTWAWLAAMTAEFGVPAWLKARPVLYLVSHMAIMPLIDLVLTGAEWAGRGAPDGLWLFLLLSLVNGCVLELGRKTWAPASEREGVESYSALWGPDRAVLTWLGFVTLASILLAAVGHAVGAAWPLTLVAVAGLAATTAVALRFRADPTVSRERQVDAAAGLWVLACYAGAGFLPLLFGGGA